MQSLHKTRIISVLLIVFLLASSHAAYTATSLSLQPTSVNMGIITANDYETGYKEKLDGDTLLVTDTTNDWKLMVRSNDGNMGVIGSYTKAITDFYWRAQGDNATQASYTSIATYDIEAARGLAGSSIQVTIDYKVLLAWAQDVPGTYNINVVYTLTTQ